MKTQLCLLSGELMPNVIGVLHDQPHRVVCVATERSAEQVRPFKSALGSAGCRPDFGDPVVVEPYNLPKCTETINRVASPADGLTVNWTGGTKVMSYAARRVAQDLCARALYVNTADSQILIEEPAGAGPARVESLNSAKLGLNTLVHIQAAGHSVDCAPSLGGFRRAHTPAPELRAAAEAIVEAPPYYWPDYFKLSEAFDKAFIPRRLNPKILRLLEDAKIILGDSATRFLLHAETLGRPFHRSSGQEENAKFIRGGYLEVFLWSQLKDRGAFDDVAWHLMLNPGARGRGAELDVVVSGEGRLLTVESKGRLDLSELSDLIEEQYARTRRIGRLFGHWVVYIHQFRAEYQSSNAAAILKSQEARARDYGGRIFWHDDLVDFPVLVAGYLNEVRPGL